MDDIEIATQLKASAELKKDLNNLNRFGALSLEKALFYHKLKLIEDVNNMNKENFIALFQNDSLNSR